MIVLLIFLDCFAFSAGAVFYVAAKSMPDNGVVTICENERCKQQTNQVQQSGEMKGYK